MCREEGCARCAGGRSKPMRCGQAGIGAATALRSAPIPLGHRASAAARTRGGDTCCHAHGPDVPRSMQPPVCARPGCRHAHAAPHQPARPPARPLAHSAPHTRSPPRIGRHHQRGDHPTHCGAGHPQPPISRHDSRQQLRALALLRAATPPTHTHRPNPPARTTWTGRPSTRSRRPERA